MIKLCRLDDRMIHGQIVTKWSRVVPIDRIIVANDKAGTNPIIAKSLLMAAPGNIKVAVKTVDKAIEMLKNPKAALHDIMLIVASPQDLLTVVENVSDIEKVNIGNWGLLESTDGIPRVKVSTYVAFSKEEKEMMRKVTERVNDCVIQVTPDVNSVKLNSIL